MRDISTRHAANAVTQGVGSILDTCSKRHGSVQICAALRHTLNTTLCLRERGVELFAITLSTVNQFRQSSFENRLRASLV